MTGDQRAAVLAEAAAAVAATRYYEGDGHMDAGRMLAMAERNVLALIGSDSAKEKVSLHRSEKV